MMMMMMMMMMITISFRPWQDTRNKSQHNQYVVTCQELLQNFWIRAGFRRGEFKATEGSRFNDLAYVFKKLARTRPRVDHYNRTHDSERVKQVRVKDATRQDQKTTHRPTDEDDLAVLALSLVGLSHVHHEQANSLGQLAPVFHQRMHACGPAKARQINRKDAETGLQYWNDKSCAVT
jgi:hypothetical protein